MDSMFNSSKNETDWTAMPLADEWLEPLRSFDALRNTFRKWIDEAYERQVALPFMGQHDELTFVRPWIFHYLLTGEPDLLDKTDEFFQMWKEWAQENFVHGYYPRDAEEHHQPEHFLRVVGRLWMFDTVREDYRNALLDMTEHIGNWSDDSPAWYDWNNHRFVARWLGTQQVDIEKDQPRASGLCCGEFRYLILAQQAYLLTGEKQYMDLIIDYTDKWCEIIQQYQNDPAGIPVWVAPDSGEPLHEDRKSKWFIFSGAVEIMLDLYRMTEVEKYARCAGILMEKACQVSLMKDPGSPDEIRECAITADKLCRYRHITGDTSLDHMAPDLLTEESSDPIPDGLELIPVLKHSRPDIRRGVGYQLNWMKAANNESSELSKRPAALYALAYQINGNPELLNTGLQLAAKRLDLIRTLGDEARFHGCGRGFINTVVDEDVLPVLHAAALGLNGISFDGNAHLQPAVAYRGTDGRPGLPPGIAAVSRKEINGNKEVRVLNTGEQDETVMVMNLYEVPHPGLVGKGLKAPMTIPWVPKTGTVFKLEPGSGRAITFYN